MPRVSYPSKGLSGAIEPGITIHHAVYRLGHVIDFACGGNALCGTCCVTVLAGGGYLSPIAADEAERLGELDHGPRCRLACQARILSADGEITVVAR